VLKREIPFLRIIIPLCFGIIAGLWFNPGRIFYYVFSTAILFTFLYSFRFNDRLTNRLFGIALTFSLAVFGLALYSLEKKSISELPSRVAWYYGYLDEYPEEKENSFRLILKLEGKNSEGNSERLKGKILLYLKKCSLAGKMLPGDRLAVKCSPIPVISRGNPEEFDYKFYMESQGIKYYAFADSTDIFGYKPPPSRKVSYGALIVREKIIDMFRQRGITGEKLALISAITLGQKNMLEQEQKQWFIKAGIMHIMAVSGLHAVILSLFIFQVLFFLKGKLHFARVLITIILLWAFAFITGLTPSVLRATIMFTFLQAGTLLKRPANSINSVLASAFVLMLVRPSVIFDAGFLLSYAAVIYIISFYRDFYSKIRFRHKIPDWLWQSASVTIIAQAGTLPLTIMLFNRFPTWFILSNVVIVPISSLVIIVGALVPLTYSIVPASTILAKVLAFLTGLTEMLTEKAAGLPCASISNIGMTTIECVFLTVAIFLLTRFLLVRKSLSPIYPISAFLLFFMAGTIKNIATKSTSQLLVYNTSGYYAVGIREGKNLEIFTDSLFAGPEIKRHCDVFGLKLHLNLVEKEPAFIRSEGREIILVETLAQGLRLVHKNGILVITGNNPKGMLLNNAAVQPKAIVFTSLASQGFWVKGRNGMPLADTVAIIRANGAFIEKL